MAISGFTVATTTLPEKELPRVSGAEAVIRSSLAEGVDTIFGYPGGAITPVYDALYDHLDNISHILVRNDEEKVANLVKQIEKKVDVLKAFCYTPKDVVLQQIALYKVQRCSNVEEMVSRHNVRILDIHDDYMVIEKTGHKEEIDELYRTLLPYGLYQFVCSGPVAIIKQRRELMDEYMQYVEECRKRIG